MPREKRSSRRRAAKASRTATGPEVCVTNAQRRDEVSVAWLARVARCAVARLSVRGAGTLTIVFIDGHAMRRLNRQFAGHIGLTDVLTFRYPGELVIGEIVISPEFAKTYSIQHRVPYRQELARYVIHGILHWTGLEDRTPWEQYWMRERENRLLAQCVR